MCKNSRFLNGHVSFGTVGHVPSKRAGGQGFTGFHGPGFIKLHGRVHQVMVNPHCGGGGQFHTHMLPDVAFIDGARYDFNGYYHIQAHRLRSYLAEHNPLASTLRQAGDLDDEGWSYICKVRAGKGAPRAGTSGRHRRQW